MAVWAGDHARVRALLAAGGDPLRLEPGDNVPWLWAVVAGDEQMLEVMLRASNDRPLEIGAERGLALRLAAGIDHRRLAREILRRGGHVDEPLGERATPLTVAAGNGHLEMVRLLLEAGARVDAADLHGDTALMAAVRDGSVEVVRELLARGADPDRRDASNRSARDWARRGRSREMQDLLRVAPAPAPAPGVERDARAAVTAAVGTLQRGVASWDAATECVACHHHPMLARVVAVAERHALPHDRAQAKAFRAEMNANEQRYARKVGKVLASPGDALAHSMENGGDVAWGIGWFATAFLDNGSITPAPGTAELLAQMQRPDGSWRRGPPRIPLESSDFTATANAVRTLRELAPATTSAHRERALGWLRAHRPETLDDHAYRLLGLHWAGANADEIAAAARALAALQQPGGGWAHRTGRIADAYATGLALWALHEAKHVTPADELHQRGVRYLLETQEPDGSWLVPTRAVPVLPYVDTGFPHGKHQFISFTGTAWAAIAIAPTIGATDRGK